MTLPPMASGALVCFARMYHVVLHGAVGATEESNGVSPGVLPREVAQREHQAIDTDLPLFNACHCAGQNAPMELSLL